MDAVNVCDGKTFDKKDLSADKSAKSWYNETHNQIITSHNFTTLHKLFTRKSRIWTICFIKQLAFQLLPLTTEVFLLDLALQHACHNSRQADQSISAYPHPNPGSCIFLMSKNKIQQAT